MKNLFQKILVPVDGSVYSFNAAEYAIRMPSIIESEIILLSVVPSMVKYGGSSGIFGAIPPKYFKKYENEAVRWFNKIIEKTKGNTLENKIIKTKVIITPLSIVSAILRYTEKEDASLIIMGTRGITGFKRFLLGSVASGVVTYAHCPVLVIR